MPQITAKIICDSVSSITKTRLTTMELSYHRYIHSEFMTHRVFCLDGDSKLEFDLPTGAKEKKFKRLFTMKLSEFYNKWTTGDSIGRSMSHRLTKMRIRILNEKTHKIETSNVVNCINSGKKEVFQITAGNKTVAGSKDHRILTTDGWKTIAQLVVGKDHIITERFGKHDHEYLDALRYNKFNEGWKSTWLNQIRKSKLKDQDNQCFDCGTDLTIIPHELHHSIPVYQDQTKVFDYDNIIGLCENCHKERHHIQGWQGGTYLYGEPQLLTAVISLGVKETFDLEIAGEYPNFIANGIVVHNSRNASSSRAIPIKTLLKQVRNDPMMPVYWGSNKPGMQAGDELTGWRLKLAKGTWLIAAKLSTLIVKTMEWVGVHKQIANRLLEPFLPIKVVVTSTEWDNFFHLRDHKDAQPEIQELARRMKEAMDNSIPKTLQPGEWHLPYLGEAEIVGTRLDLAQKASAARCARVSYLNHDKTECSLDGDLALFNMLATRPFDDGKGHVLLADDPVHLSPLEHQSTPIGDDITQYYNKKGITHISFDGLFGSHKAKPIHWSGNLRNWIQYRQTQ